MAHETDPSSSARSSSWLRRLLGTAVSFLAFAWNWFCAKLSSSKTTLITSYNKLIRERTKPPKNIEEKYEKRNDGNATNLSIQERDNPSRKKEGQNSKDEHGHTAHQEKPMLVRLLRFLLRRRRSFISAQTVEILLAAAIAVATWTQAKIYWEQSIIMRSSLQQNEGSIALNMGQLAVANRNAKTAERANKISREALESVQRAFVTFQQINLETLPTFQGDKRTWVFTALVENSGTTPAINKIGFFSGDKLQSEPSEEQFIGNEKNPPIGEIGSKATKGIGPLIREETFILGNYPLSSITSEDFVTFFRSRRAYFWGWVGYRDVFPNTRPHITEFCQVAIGIAAGIPGVPRPAHIDATQLQQLHVDMRWQECVEHNCTDEHCKDYEAIAAKVPK